MQRTLVLDLDGTLVDSAPDLAASLNRLMTSRGLAAFDRPTVASMVGNGAAALVASAFARHEMAPDDTALADFLADYTINAANETKPYPGVPETLAALRAHGWVLAICTNKPILPTRHLLDHLGLTPLFAAIGGGDSYPVRKPNPAHLLSTLRDAGGNPARAIMVGDHHNDMLAAQGAAIPAIFATWGYGTPEQGRGAAAVADRFSDIPHMAEAILPS